MCKASVFVFVMFAMATAQSRADDSSRIFVVYDEQMISDGDRAVLLNALCEVLPENDWRYVIAPTSTTVSRIVDDYYDYWDNPTKEFNPYPLSTAAISYHIRRANKNAIFADDSISAGTQLRIPPLPVRGYWRSDNEFLIRVYDPATQSYSTIESLDKLVPKPQYYTDAMATKGHPFRNARLTLVEIPDWQEFVKKLNKKDKLNPLNLPDDAVLVKGEQQLVKVDLFACDATGLVSDPPPYAFTKEEVDRFRAELPQRLAQKPPFPLWIIDWNIDVENGHGAKVLSVVHDVLDNLGLCALKDYVRPFDLNPIRNPELKELFRKFRNDYEQNYGRDANFDKNTGPIVFAAAEAWIDHGPFVVDEGDSQIVTINEFVLQAVLWRFMYGTPKWVNMSFTLIYPQSQILNAKYMDKSKAATFAFVAAGNTRNFVTPGAFPQAGAMGYPNSVNITFGKADGFVEGAVTREKDDAGVPVHIVAPGCLKSGACGSSYASPFVAVTAWLRHVFSETQPAQMRSVLRRANHPAPYREKMVESRGYYDPVLLFRPDGGSPQIVTNDGQRLGITNATLQVKYLRGSATDTWSTEVGMVRTGARLSVFPCADAGSGFCVWFDKDGDDRVPEVVSLVSIKVHGGGLADEWTPADFAAKRAELWF